MSETTQGRRVYSESGYSFGRMERGDYGMGPDGRWWLMSPWGDRGLIKAEIHSVVEFPDGTITISPSTMFQEQHGEGDPPVCFPRFGWHGYLERGVWREC